MNPASQASLRAWEAVMLSPVSSEATPMPFLSRRQPGFVVLSDLEHCGVDVRKRQGI